MIEVLYKSFNLLENNVIIYLFYWYLNKVAILF